MVPSARTVEVEDNHNRARQAQHDQRREQKHMQLGKFSVSLNVKDIHASRVFYETLGFTVTNDNEAHHWLVMKNGEATIGLFQGMFERNMFTFNPGWDPNSQ